jgi:hypothetical protein
MKPFNQLLIDIGNKQKESFQKYNVGYMSALVNGKSPKGLMKWVYDILVSEKLLIKLELQPYEKRKSIWTDTLDFIKQFANQELTKEEKIELAKSFYAIEYFLN